MNPKVKKCKSKYPIALVANLCQIMASKHLNPILEHTMKLAVPTLNHDIVMKFLGKVETVKQDNLFFKWEDKSGFK